MKNFLKPPPHYIFQTCMETKKMAMTIQFQLNWTYPVQCCKKFWENTLHKVLIPVHIDIVFFSMAFSIFGDSLHLGPIEIAKGLSYIDIDKGSRQWPLVPPVRENGLLEMRKFLWGKASPPQVLSDRFLRGYEFHKCLRIKRKTPQVGVDNELMCCPKCPSCATLISTQYHYITKSPGMVTSLDPLFHCHWCLWNAAWSPH